jgi:glutamate-5-semialdehyde dehydrogenase
MALKIVENAKAQRPGVCNAMETVLIHESRAKEMIPLLYQKLARYLMEWHGCPETVKILKGREHVKRAGKDDFDTEYLDLKMNCRVVKSYDEAVRHIEEHGSRHSESIVTKNEETARNFQTDIDAAAVYWNASTRFTDGFELGLGGEMGISTQKLHVRGPVGLKELTSLRWIIDGSGQIRS